MLLGGIKNLFILNLGDPKQNGFEGTLESGGKLTCFESPSLDISIRANNNHKKDNLNSLATIIDSLQRQTEAFKAGTAGISGIASALDLVKGDGFFKYSEENNLVKGEKVVKEMLTSSEIEKIILNLQDGENLAYIYSNRYNPSPELVALTTKYPGKFVVVDSKDVQGSEYNYTIINVDYKSVDKTNSPDEITDALKNLYTLMSRSKDGSTIVSTTSCLPRNSKSYKTFTKNTFNPKEVSDYRNFIMEVYKGLELEEPSKETPTTPTAIGTPSITTSVSGGTIIEKVNTETAKKDASLETPGNFTVHQSHIMYNIGSDLKRNLGK